VYNVAMPLLARTQPDRPPFLIVEIPREPEAAPTQAPGTTSTAPPLVRTA
jgi:hypothetical protein